jgi:hypothetical protein
MSVPGFKCYGSISTSLEDSFKIKSVSGASFFISEDFAKSEGV